MSEPLTPSPPRTERWLSWAAFLVALALGWVSLWALGWSIDLAAEDRELPAHALWRKCPGLDNQQFLSLVVIGLLTAAGVTLIRRGRRRGGWGQVDLWAGFVLIADALLMVQYLRYFLPTPLCD